MAGYIHHTEGEVWLGDRAIAPKPEDFEHLLEGRRLRTGQGRAELLLVPGSFVRIGAKSEIEMISSGLTSAVLRLHSGSLVVDLQTQFEDDSIAVQVGDHEIRFRKTGLYRIDAREATTLRVLSGRARVTTGASEERDIKSGRGSDLSAGPAVKLGEPQADPLSAWHEKRHEKLAVLAERARKERWEGMSEAERDMLRMILYRPTGPTVSNRPEPRAPSSSGRQSR